MKKVMALAALLVAVPIIANGQLRMGQYSKKQVLTNNVSSQPLAFTENKGQWDSKVLFLAQAGGVVFFFCRDEVAYMFTRNTDQLEESPIPDISNKFDRVHYKPEAILIKAQFVGANPEAGIIGENRLSQYSNYFYGNNPAKWRTRVPSYSSVTYKDIYPGIDLKYYGNGQSMKYDFIVAPGADISQIQIHYEGTNRLGVTPNGDLETATSFGPVYEQTPIIYQEINGQRREISGRYIIIGAGVFGFAIDDGYNPALPLVIDPELVYSTYLGGSDIEWGGSIAVDNNGCAYVTGYARSTDFPLLNPYQQYVPTTYYDVFVTKFAPSGNAIIYSTYIGGSNSDHGNGIAVDDSGCAYLTGDTYSDDFPTTGLYQTHHQEYDAYVTKLSPAGDSLIYSTYLGGNGSESGSGITIDKRGNAYIVGTTLSTNFPLKNPFQQDQNGIDAFVTKLAPAGDSLVYSTYLGGYSVDGGTGIAVDKEGNAYVTGYTFSDDFPTRYSYQTLQGNSDVFVTKFNPAGTIIIYSTFLGGNYEDRGLGITLDEEGCAYITGYSNSSNYPAINPFQTHLSFKDVIVTKLSPTRCNIVYSTYIGGNDDEYGYGISVDKSGSAYITGCTGSYNFPTQNPFQPDQSFYDAFMLKLSPSGNSLDYSTYMGGTSDDYGYAIALDGNDDAYIMGATYSPDYPLQNPYMAFQSISDIFVTKFGGLTGIEDDGVSLPQNSGLRNYPNPFNSSTLINYQIDTRASVSLSIYNLLGQRVATLCEQYQEPGIYSAVWDAKNVSSGVYLCRLEIGGRSEYSKMVLMK